MLTALSYLPAALDTSTNSDRLPTPMCGLIVMRQAAACRVAAPRLFSLTNESIR